MNPQPPTPQPIPDNTLLDDFYPARFLQVSDLLDRWKVQNKVVIVSRFTKEPTVPNSADIDPETRKPRIVIQPVFYFKSPKTGQEWPSGYLLSAKIDIESLKASTGATTAGEVIGRKVIIMVGEHKHKAVLRIDTQPVKDD